MVEEYNFSVIKLVSGWGSPPSKSTIVLPKDHGNSKISLVTGS